MTPLAEYPLQNIIHRQSYILHNQDQENANNAMPSYVQHNRNKQEMREVKTNFRPALERKGFLQINKESGSDKL